MTIRDVGPVGGQADIARGPSLPKRFQKDARRTRRARLVLVRASQFQFCELIALKVHVLGPVQ